MLRHHLDIPCINAMSVNIDADDHKVRVLTRSRAKARLVFPGKKVMNISSNSCHELHPKLH